MILLQMQFYEIYEVHANISEAQKDKTLSYKNRFEYKTAKV